ncbi:MAG: hypothetical protein D4R64_02690 [Porphyromonadaceae bacterium]|nr:MAG: hypothetical protein D4R64_02690 [Porphyromonadaceae bacterium]
MKKLGYFLSISALAIFSLVVLFPACEGPAGPAGKDGLNGTDGKDVNAFCVKCHNQATFSSVEAQFATSLHGEGETWAGDGNHNPCAMCHSYQGYKETKLTGRDSVAVVPAIPVALQCDACHDFHGTLDSTDFPNYALGHTEPISLIYNNHASTIDFGNSSNLCAYCHQPRPRGTDFPVPTTGEKEYKVTTIRWGPHYGTQSIVLNGTNGWEYAGSMAYTSTNHKGVATCPSCHMAAGVGTENGGHTWRINNADDTKVNLTGCKKCHADATSTDINGRQTEIEGLLNQLGDRLIALKLLNAVDHLALVYNKEPGKMTPWTAKEAGAFFNYKVIAADRSMGVHNYKYTKALLVNSLEAIQ